MHWLYHWIKNDAPLAGVGGRQGNRERKKSILDTQKFQQNIFRNGRS